MDQTVFDAVKKPFHTVVHDANILLYPMEEVRTVVIRVMFHAGSWYESRSQLGLFHLLEHMSFQGTALFPNIETLNEFEESHAISSNAVTSGRSIVYLFKLPYQSIEPALTLLEERIFNPTFPESELQREIKVITQEYKDLNFSPSRLFEKKYSKRMLGPSHIYNQSPIGSLETISKATCAGLRSLHDRFITPAQMVVGVVGRFDCDHVLERFSTILESRTPHPRINVPIIPPKPKQDQYIWHKMASKSTGLVLRWMITDTDQWTLRQEIALNLASYLIGGSHQARLFRELRQRLGLVYSIDSDYWFLPNIGIFEVAASVANDQVDEVVAVINQVLNSFISEPIPSEDVDRARKYMGLRTMMRFDSISDIADMFLTELFYEDRIVVPQEYVQIASMITEDEIRSILKQFLLSRPYLGAISSQNPWKNK
ncbi:insulinase family protein [candidate division WWE3 bacterium]|nr:insulinase family protein [candidate division WWE3 bacterium]